MSRSASYNCRCNWIQIFSLQLTHICKTSLMCIHGESQPANQRSRQSATWTGARWQIARGSRRWEPTAWRGSSGRGGLVGSRRGCQRQAVGAAVSPAGRGLRWRVHRAALVAPPRSDDQHRGVQSARLAAARSLPGTRGRSDPHTHTHTHTHGYTLTDRQLVAHWRRSGVAVARRSPSANSLYVEPG